MLEKNTLALETNVLHVGDEHCSAGDNVFKKAI